MPYRPFVPCASLAVLTVLGACGTTYDVPPASEANLIQARAMFAEEQDPATAQRGERLAPAMAMVQYQRVVAKVEPVAEQFCRSQTAEIPGFNCDVTISVDAKTAERNAYQHYGSRGEPQVAITLPFIADARNPDELAFVLGHEFGHHIAQHIEKQQQQAVAGALILGALTAYGQAQATAANPYRYTGGDSREMQNMMNAGAAVGQMAFSQTYELESDVIATYITRAAGFDPVLGARFFAKPEEPRTPGGALSFWGTHPADETRLATVLETVGRLDAQGAAAE
ncbi:peptidase M48, Ste24p [Rubellimicrobium rubrum]|uniref:Peptidase M48, Ste24p n=1 Tax=Rubellimicrobium rubrum TaxID=2585369 RepID=A0A5C4MMN4_9RHOB|nr:M48 family metalloprotease [Rubellimicrobium rubrum]TNC45139.1 peptidase M48, Ste24p [Rubellimicrobium rubrum]